MNGSVLVLNRQFHPVHVTSTRRAMVMLYSGIAKALDRQFELYDFENWAALRAEESERLGRFPARSAG
mgnify:CR=1 FL=1